MKLREATEAEPPFPPTPSTRCAKQTEATISQKDGSTPRVHRAAARGGGRDEENRRRRRSPPPPGSEASRCAASHTLAEELPDATPRSPAAFQQWCCRVCWNTQPPVHRHGPSASPLRYAAVMS